MLHDICTNVSGGQEQHNAHLTWVAGQCETGQQWGEVSPVTWRQAFLYQRCNYANIMLKGVMVMSHWSPIGSRSPRMSS